METSSILFLVGTFSLVLFVILQLFRFWLRYESRKAAKTANSHFKKHDSVNLSFYRPLGLNTGLIVVLSFLLVAFEWETKEEEPIEFSCSFNSLNEFELMPPLPTQNPDQMLPPVMVEQEMSKPELINTFGNFEKIEINDDLSCELEIEEVKKEPKEEISEDFVCEFIEEAAKPQGGYPAFYEYITKNKESLPNCEGKVYVSFIIEKDSTLSTIQVIKGLEENCNQEALRLIRENPTKWIPAKNKGKIVRQKIVIPVKFN